MTTTDIQTEPTELELAWQRHVAADTALLDRLITRHRERQRRYHKVGHVETVVRHVTELAAHETLGDLDAVIAAAFYHDAVYEPTHPANERASARLAHRDLQSLGWAAGRADAVSAMITATSTHLDPPDTDTAVLFDADLAILGAEPDIYRDYATKIRAEYNHLDDAEWRAGRGEVLRAFLARPSLFATERGRELWEAAARTNITAELATLTIE